MSTKDIVEFCAGDRVRHEDRPEWGIGRVKRVENIQIGGKPSQRLMIEFPNAGLKKLSSIGAALSRVSDNGVAPDDGATMLEREHGHESGWLGEISKSKPEDAMTHLPIEVTDPFRLLEVRLRETFKLYRFNRDGASLIDWAVARSGLDDPLSRFNRHELEQFFDRWSHLRDQHLSALLKETGGDRALVTRLIADAPAAAKRAVGRCNAL